MKKFLFVFLIISNTLGMHMYAALPSKASSNSVSSGYIGLSLLATVISASMQQYFNKQSVYSSETSIDRWESDVNRLEKVKNDLTALTWQNKYKLTQEQQDRLFAPIQEVIEPLKLENNFFVKEAWNKLFVYKYASYASDKNEYDSRYEKFSNSLDSKIESLKTLINEFKTKYQQECTALARKKIATKLTTMGLAATTLVLIANKCYRCLYHR